MADQVAKRIWGIASADFWPSITPLNVGALTVTDWVQLAVLYDARVAAIKARQSNSSQSKRR